MPFSQGKQDVICSTVVHTDGHKSQKGRKIWVAPHFISCLLGFGSCWHSAIDNGWMSLSLPSCFWCYPSNVESSKCGKSRLGPWACWSFDWNNRNCEVWLTSDIFLMMDVQIYPIWVIKLAFCCSPATAHLRQLQKHSASVCSFPFLSLVLTKLSRNTTLLKKPSLWALQPLNIYHNALFCYCQNCAFRWLSKLKQTSYLLREIAVTQNTLCILQCITSGKHPMKEEIILDS